MFRASSAARRSGKICGKLQTKTRKAPIVRKKALCEGKRQGNAALYAGKKACARNGGEKRKLLKSA